MTQEKHLFEYAVIRVVPMVEREEFINVGIIIYSKQQKFLQCLYHLDKERLKALSTAIDINEVEDHLKSFERICKGSTDGGPIAKLDIASRFRWLTAIRSSAIQTSRPHSGYCEDLDKTIQRLFEELVL